MIAFLFPMGAQVWVPLPLCCLATALFLEAVGLSLEILIFVGQIFYYRHQFFVGGGNLGVVIHYFPHH